MKIRQTKPHKKTWLIIVLSVLVIGLFTAYFLVAKNTQSDKSSRPSGDTNKSTPTQESDNQKDPEPSDKVTPPNTDHATPTTDGSSGKQVVPMATTANVDGSIVFIRGGINVIVDGGSCFASLVGPNGEKIRKDTTLLPNSSTTDCKTIQVPIAELSQGKWTYTLNYLSDKAEGASSVVSFTI